VLLGLSVLALGVTIVVTSQRHPGGDNPGGPPVAAAGDWISLRSTAPADVLAAARQSSMFQEDQSSGGDHITNLSRLGTPVLVRALQPAEAIAGQFPDFYVVPILDASGAATDAAELALNQAHTAIQVIAIVTYSQPHADGAIARMTAATAVTAVGAQQHTALRPGTTPQLVYFPADANAQETGQVTWTGGGEFPADPMWLVPGTDGRDHLVGVDGRTYTPEQLPMIKVGGA
jgi:hypothetical protein